MTRVSLLPRAKQKLAAILFTGAVLLAHPAFAAEEGEAPVTPAALLPAPVQNARLDAFEGSASRWSAQLRFIYTGSTLRHPLAGDAVNPGNVNPAPVVKLETFIASRYRIDESQSLGLRGDIVTEKPLQKPQHITSGDPTIDYALSSTAGHFRNRFDVNYEHLTSHSYAEEGFTDNLEVYDNMIYDTPLGLILGVDWIVDYNVFDLSKASPAFRFKSGENDLDFSIIPALEYPLTKTVSFRTQSTIVFAHARDRHYETYSQLPTAQLVGVTVGLGKYGYVNPYVTFAPFDGKKVTRDTIAVGMAATVNLF